jgi:hypothetical protein
MEKSELGQEIKNQQHFFILAISSLRPKLKKKNTKNSTTDNSKA